MTNNTVFEINGDSAMSSLLSFLKINKGPLDPMALYANNRRGWSAGLSLLLNNSDEIIINYLDKIESIKSCNFYGYNFIDLELDSNLAEGKLISLNLILWLKLSIYLEDYSYKTSREIIKRSWGLDIENSNLIYVTRDESLFETIPHSELRKIVGDKIYWPINYEETLWGKVMGSAEKDLFNRVFSYNLINQILILIQEKFNKKEIIEDSQLWSKYLKEDPNEYSK